MAISFIDMDIIWNLCCLYCLFNYWMGRTNLWFII